MNERNTLQSGPIGLFDSGYGGLTILEEICHLMPQYDYLYLGDNARTPYGTRSFELVYEFTLQAVKQMFDWGCPLVILACNTASAKALRTIQQNDLPKLNIYNRVLGVIRPTAEVVGGLTRNGHIGVLATTGTILSHSYELEIEKLYPQLTVTGESCPMWVPLVENREHAAAGSDYFVQKYICQLLEKDPAIDTIILGCTHYPLLLEKIRKYTPSHIRLIPQGEYVAQSLSDYLKRHPEMESRCTKGGQRSFFTTESEQKFIESASIFFSRNNLQVKSISLG
ncbi:MAG: glutamate racemase [Phocaeicola sp.]